MPINLPYDAFIDAIHYSAEEAWFFQSPKVTVICGNCHAQTSSREWRKMTGTKKIVVCCSICGKWNITGFIYKK